VGGVAQDRGGDPPASGANEQPAIGPGGGQGEAAFEQGRTSGIRGTVRARLPLVPLSTSPPGEVVVWRRTVQNQRLVSMSTARQPETSPMRAAVAAANTTMSPQR
jgi:hypothetical protein